MKLTEALQSIARYEETLKARYYELLRWRAYGYITPLDEFIYNQQRALLYTVQMHTYGDLLRGIRGALLYVGLQSLGMQIPVPKMFPSLPPREVALAIVEAGQAQRPTSGLGSPYAVVAGSIGISSWAVLVLAIAGVVVIASAIVASAWLISALQKLDADERILARFWEERRRVIQNCLNRGLRAEDCAELAQQLTEPRDALPEDSMFNWEPTSIAKWGLGALAVLGLAAFVPATVGAIVSARAAAPRSPATDEEPGDRPRLLRSPLVWAGVVGVGILGLMVFG